jgi:hypothetical protein
MPPLDVRPIADQMIVAVKSHTEREVAPVRAKVAALETGLAALPTKDFVSAAVQEARAALTLDIMAALARAGGGALTVEDVTPLIEKLVAALPAPKDGAPGADGRDGRDGTSVEPAQVEAMVEKAVTRAATALIPPDPPDDVKSFADAITMRFTAAAIA